MRWAGKTSGKSKDDNWDYCSPQVSKYFIITTNVININIILLTSGSYSSIAATVTMIISISINISMKLPSSVTYHIITATVINIITILIITTKFLIMITMIKQCLTNTHRQHQHKNCTSDQMSFFFMSTEFSIQRHGPHKVTKKQPTILHTSFPCTIFHTQFLQIKFYPDMFSMYHFKHTTLGSGCAPSYDNCFICFPVLFSICCICLLCELHVWCVLPELH